MYWWLYYLSVLVCILCKAVALFVPTTILYLLLVMYLWKASLVVLTSLSALQPALIIFCRTRWMRASAK